MNSETIAKKAYIKKEIVTNEPTTRDYVCLFMADQETSDFQLMLREAEKPRNEVDYAMIGRLFKRAYDNSINDYVSVNL